VVCILDQMLVRYGQYAMFSIPTSGPRLEMVRRRFTQNEPRMLLIHDLYDTMALGSIRLAGTRLGWDKVCRPNHSRL
jgi:hypothetical protein